jgi:hypothetical protein
MNQKNEKKIKRVVLSIDLYAAMKRYWPGGQENGRPLIIFAECNAAQQRILHYAPADRKRGGCQRDPMHTQLIPLCF